MIIGFSCFKSSTFLINKKKNTHTLGAGPNLPSNFIHLCLNNRSLNIIYKGTEIGNNDELPRVLTAVVTGTVPVSSVVTLPEVLEDGISEQCSA